MGRASLKEDKQRKSRFVEEMTEITREALKNATPEEREERLNALNDYLYELGRRNHAKRA